MDDITETQRNVFNFIKARLTSGYSAPTMREIAAEFKYRSKRAAEDHVKGLVRKGWLKAEAGKARSLRLAQPSRSSNQTVMEIPFLGSIPAGAIADREQENEQCIPVAVDSVGFKPTRNTFALKVVGDSMIGKHICDGDIVLLEHGAEPRHGQVVAALIDRKSTLKTFLLKNRKPYLRAENPNYPDLIPCEELVIQGVFRALIRGSKATV